MNAKPLKRSPLCMRFRRRPSKLPIWLVTAMAIHLAAVGIAAATSVA